MTAILEGTRSPELSPEEQGQQNFSMTKAQRSTREEASEALRITETIRELPQDRPWVYLCGLTIQALNDNMGRRLMKVVAILWVGPELASGTEKLLHLLR